MTDRKGPEDESRFQRWALLGMNGFLGWCPHAVMNAAPSALNVGDLGAPVSDRGLRLGSTPKRERTIHLRWHYKI